MGRHAQLLEDHKWVHIASDAKARKWRSSIDRLIGAAIGFPAGIGFTVLVGLIYAHRHGWLY